MRALWWLTTLPVRAVWGLVVFLWVVCTGDAGGRDEDVYGRKLAPHRARWSVRRRRADQ